MSTHGIKDVTFGLVDSTGTLITSATTGLSASGIALIDGDGEGATQANVTGLEATGTVGYANDGPKRVSNGVSEPQVALDFLDIDFDTLQKLKGFTNDGKGGWTRVLPKPHVAMLLHSRSYSGVDIYEGFANGQLIEAGTNHSTDNASESDADTTLTYQALVPLKDGVFNGEPYKIWTAADTDFAKADMYSEVFGGYTASTTTGTTTSGN